jgi:hypothetical protein
VLFHKLFNNAVEDFSRSNKIGLSMISFPTWRSRSAQYRGAIAYLRSLASLLAASNLASRAKSKRHSVRDERGSWGRLRTHRKKAAVA